MFFDSNHNKNYVIMSREKDDTFSSNESSVVRDSSSSKNTTVLSQCRIVTPNRIENSKSVAK